VEAGEWVVAVESATATIRMDPDRVRVRAGVANTPVVIQYKEPLQFERRWAVRATARLILDCGGRRWRFRSLRAFDAQGDLIGGAGEGAWRAAEADAPMTELLDRVCAGGV